MDVYEAIQQRRSIRHYKPDPIPEDVLVRLLEAMRLAPSGGNCQPWKFIVVQDRETINKLAAACTYATPGGEIIYQNWIAEAPLVMVACGYEREATVKYYEDEQVTIGDWDDFAREMTKGPVKYESELLVDLAIALDHLSLVAVQEGLGTCWVGGLNEKMVKEILSVPADMRAPGLMPVGYPAEAPKLRPRKPIEEIVFYEKYG